MVLASSICKVNFSSCQPYCVCIDWGGQLTGVQNSSSRMVQMKYLMV